MGIANERLLWAFADKAQSKNIKFTRFFEPDLGHSLTAICLEPGEATRRLCCSLPLALKHSNNNTEYAIKKLVHDMSVCTQTKDQTILEHGIAVKDYLFDLIGFLRGKELTKQWRLPEWLIRNKEKLNSRLLDDYTLYTYAIFHDCGKPYCLEIDSEGRRHFNDHAEVSKNIWLSISSDQVIANLISKDMVIHTTKPNQLFNFDKQPEMVSLLLTALAEVHCNSEMFGGINSISFKQKWHHINKWGEQICKKL